MRTLTQSAGAVLRLVGSAAPLIYVAALLNAIRNAIA
jgi:hypothetical protein